MPAAADPAAADRRPRPDAQEDAAGERVDVGPAGGALGPELRLAPPPLEAGGMEGVAAGGADAYGLRQGEGLEADGAVDHAFCLLLLPFGVRFLLQRLGDSFRWLVFFFWRFDVRAPR